MIHIVVMSDNTLIQKIKADTEVTIAEIQAKQAADVAAIKAETETVITELTATHTVELAKAKQHTELVETAKARQVAKLARQTAKREQIETVFTGVQTYITNLPEGEYVRFFAKHAAMVVPAGTAISSVEAPANRQVETQKILNEISVKADVIASNLAAGLILHSDDGVYDVSLKRLFGDRRADFEMEIVSQL